MSSGKAKASFLGVLLFSFIVSCFEYFYQSNDNSPDEFSVFAILPFVLLFGTLIFCLAMMRKQEKINKS